MMGAAAMLGVVQMLVAQIAAFLAALLLASGLHKLARREHLRSVVQDFARVPRVLAPAAVVGIAALELAAGALLWLPAFRTTGAALAVLIWGGYLVLILRAIALGRRDVDCGCTFGAAQRPLGAYQVVRNSSLIGLAMWAAVSSVSSDSGPVIGSQILAAFALLALYGALDQVMALTPLRRGELL